MKGFLFSLALVFQQLSVLGQAPSSIRISLFTGESPLELKSAFSLPQMEGVQMEIDRFKCYLTHVRLVHSEGRDSTCLEDQLLDASDPSSWKLSHADAIGLRPGELRFLIGVDSTVQVGQTQGGVLDPIRGMYWTWQAGYIHWKVEGSFLSGAKSRFEYHIGGYRKPYGTTQHVHIPFAPENEELSVDLAPFLSRVLGKDVPARIMSPGPLAHELASGIPNCLSAISQ